MAINFRELNNLADPKLKLAEGILDHSLNSALDKLPTSLDTDAIVDLPTELISQQKQLTAAEKAFSTETDNLIRQANSKLNEVKEAGNYNDLIKEARRKYQNCTCSSKS